VVTGCEALLTFFGRMCGKPAHPVTKACLHEHISDRMLCDFHIADVSNGSCQACFDADGHKCPIVIVPRETAEVTS